MEARRTKRRQFTCLHCAKKGNIRVTEKYRMVDHIYKHHVALDDCPFYCTLCMFRCTTKEALQKHVTNYTKHTALAGNNKDPTRFLRNNANPKPVSEGTDFREATQYETDHRVIMISDSLMSDHEEEENNDGLVTIKVTPEILAQLSFLKKVQEYDPCNPGMGDLLSSGTHRQTSSAAVAPPQQPLGPSAIAFNSPAVEQLPQLSRPPVIINTPASTTSSMTLNARAPKSNSSTDAYRATSMAEVLHTPVKVLSTPVAGPTLRQVSPGFHFADTLFLDDDTAFPLSPPQTRNITEVGVQTDDVRPSEANQTLLFNAIASILEAGFAKVAEAIDRNTRGMRDVDRGLTRMTSTMDRIERAVGRIAADSRPRGRPEENVPKRQRLLEDKENNNFRR
ncbi:hypothetical protein DPMN_038155 [Dreissena polymorpha]|uniref:Uncharacterized protein n=1 Tax=Dreissena polymorpha TaxID=45954 RepID=A0A9D4ME26_DREPO|nr:hypothetical protein DPMN_038155 [Dreissena polymorpha]